jgi:predicted porin
MKRNLVLALVPSVLAAAGPAHAQGGDVQAYGRLNLGLESMRSSADATRVALIGERLKYETAAGTPARNAVYLAVTRQIGPHGLRLGVARAGDGTGGAPDGQKVGFIRKGEDTGATHCTAGYDYALSRRSSVFLLYTRLANQRNGSYDFAINGLTVSPGATVRGLTLGMRHAF